MWGMIQVWESFPSQFLLNIHLQLVTNRMIKVLMLLGLRISQVWFDSADGGNTRETCHAVDYFAVSVFLL